MDTNELDRDRWGWPERNAGYEYARSLLIGQTIVIKRRRWPWQKDVTVGPITPEQADRIIAKIRGPYVDHFASLPTLTPLEP